MLGHIRKIDEQIVAAGNRLQAYTAIFILLFGTGGVIAIFLTWAKPFTPAWGWAEAVTVGFVVACALVLLASVALVAWRYFKPLPPPEKPETPPSPLDVEMTALNERIGHVSHQSSQAVADLNNVINERLSQLERVEREDSTQERLNAVIAWLEARERADRLKEIQKYFADANQKLNVAWQKYHDAASNPNSLTPMQDGYYELKRAVFQPLDPLYKHAEWALGKKVVFDTFVHDKAFVLSEVPGEKNVLDNYKAQYREWYNRRESVLSNFSAIVKEIAEAAGENAKVLAKGLPPAN